ncbi:MAG: hypothetical protein MN733_28710 [Nitrososphaera sp.]|nr:hypothetical protein [Nitrososphaera sp.]
MLYLIGSLRNLRVPEIANILRAEGYEVFDDWYAVGPEADDRWRDYEKARGRTYPEALKGLAAGNTFRFDQTHLDASDSCVLVSPPRGVRRFGRRKRRPPAWTITCA